MVEVEHRKHCNSQMIYIILKICSSHNKKSKYNPSRSTEWTSPSITMENWWKWTDSNCNLSRPYTSWWCTSSPMDSKSPTTSLKHRYPLPYQEREDQIVRAVTGDQGGRLDLLLLLHPLPHPKQQIRSSPHCLHLFWYPIAHLAINILSMVGGIENINTQLCL